MEFFWIICGFTFLGIAGFGLQILAVRSYVPRPQRPGQGSEEPPFAPPISILKPLNGLDDHLFDNLASFCEQDYAQFEILFSLQDPNDPARRVVQKIKEKFPDREISITIEACEEGWNPKVNNMLPAYRKARYPYLLISDSNVMVDRDYLKSIVQPMKDPQTGLVTNLIKGVGAKTLGSLFENLHLNSFILGNVCFLQKYLKIPCVIGKSMLLRKSDLEALGGLSAFKDILAEDHFIGMKIKERGQKVVLSNHLISNVNEYWGLRRFMNRHLRWGKMRWKILGYKYLSELIGNPVLLSMAALLLDGPSKRAFLVIGLTSLLKTLGDYHLGRRIGVSLSPLAYGLSPIKDLVIGLIWFLSIANDTVVWRGKRFAIGPNTVLSPKSPKGIRPWRYRLGGRIAVGGS
ncbi:MAG: glycosyltransferase [Desulfobacterota bacterium]|nr:glycosyltransferase [Thermodesulfobacteriota bacterium]